LINLKGKPVERGEPFQRAHILLSDQPGVFSTAWHLQLHLGDDGWRRVAEWKRGLDLGWMQFNILRLDYLFEGVFVQQGSSDNSHSGEKGPASIAGLPTSRSCEKLPEFRNNTKILKNPHALIILR